VLVERLKSSLVLAGAIVVGTLLGTGWVLTWAKLRHEQLPSQTTLAALPHSYFIDVALHSAFVPVAMTSVLGGGWVLLSLKRRRDPRATGGFSIAQWVGFGVVLIASFWILALISDTSHPHGFSYILRECLISAGCLALAAAAGKMDQRLPIRANDREESAEPATTSATGAKSNKLNDRAAKARREARAVAAPLVSITVVLVVLVASVLRISDAYFGADALPVAEAVLDTPCSDLIGGISPFAKRRSGDGRHCLVAGFYLGENNRWIYLVQREDPCHSKIVAKHSSPRLPPQLVAVKVEHVQELVVLNKPPCPQRRQGCTVC
jgi:hypothetical protein